uniref:Alpha-catulin n=1 Tax=Ascaris lumbricoides TaxID=6252 RepID=A0A0M3HP66_ASCLU
MPTLILLVITSEQRESSHNINFNPKDVNVILGSFEHRTAHINSKLARNPLVSDAMSLRGAVDATQTIAPNAPITFDPRNLEIKTKSVEQTLMPLVSQITTLVNFKEGYLSSGKRRSDRALRAALKVGSAVEAAIERFVAVGETIADENADIQPEMYDACHEARLAGASIANLNGCLVDETGTAIDKAVLVRAARQLLSSVTRVLLLADRVLVRHILRAEDKIAYSLTKLENTTNFTEFVKIFTEFGGEMVDLAHRSGDRQNDLKSEKRRTQMAVARTSLERLTMLLLTSNKTLLRHPDSESARQCRDGVFHQVSIIGAVPFFGVLELPTSLSLQMRLALQLIGFCVTDGVMPFDASHYASPSSEEILDIGMQLTANAAIKQLMEMLEMVRMTCSVGTGVRERLISALDSLCEMTQDFTDSAYTPHHHREQILDFLEECRFEMTNLIQPEDHDEPLRSEGIEVSVERLSRRLKDLRKQLQIVAMEQMSEILRANEDQLILSSIKACSVSGDIDGVEKYLDKFREHGEHVQEVCRLLHHISLTDALHVATGHAERNLRSLAPLTLLAGRTLCVHPSSRIARENVEVFCDTWAQCVNDVSRLAKETDAAASGRLAAEKHAYMSLPRPGKHGTTQKPTKPITLDVEDQQKMAKVGLEMKLLTSEVDAEAEKWDEYAENDIVKRAKAMSSMAYNMYLFTRGDGPLKTTHDLFTQAEFFAEQANKMYKTVREFSYEVPGSAEKSDLSTILEKIPIHCQQLQVLVKSPTVGKSATFSKVDSVIQETKNLMNEIAKLVTACFVCATKYEIEFRGSSVSRQALADGSEYAQRSSRESTLWRRTPSIRRTAPPPVTQHNEI